MQKKEPQIKYEINKFSRDVKKCSDSKQAAQTVFSFSEINLVWVRDSDSQVLVDPTAQNDSMDL